MILLLLLLLVALVVLVALGAAAVYVVVASRRHKTGAGAELRLIGARGSIVEPLCPEGAVLIAGELWRARSRRGARIEVGEVTVSGVSGHLLEVDAVAAGEVESCGTAGALGHNGKHDQS